MFKVIILVCSAIVSRENCNYDTARYYIQGPIVQNELICGFHGQAYLGQLAISRNISPSDWVKIVCKAEKRRLER